MAVSTQDELWSRLQEGWRLYFHKGVRRWYIYRGTHDRKIVSPSLESLCQTIYKKLKGESQLIPASVIQESRLQGQLIEDIANDLGLSKDAVYNALDKSPSEIIKPREKLQEGVPGATIEKAAEPHYGQEGPNGDLLSPIMVGGILVGVPLSVLALWFLGNLTTGKLDLQFF